MCRIAVAAALLLLASAAQAQVRKIAAVVVSPGPGFEKEALFAGKALQARLVEDPRFESIDLEAPTRAGATRRMAERAKAAQDLFARGVDALDALEYGAAAEQLAGSIDAFREADLITVFPAMVDAIGMRAVALRLNGKNNLAEDEVVRLFTLSPGYHFPADRWPPAVQSWLNRKQEAIKATAQSTLQVTSPSTIALVFVDGSFKGTTPLEVNGLVPGRHLLTLRAPGYPPKQLEVNVTPGAKVSPTLEATAEGRELLSRLENIRAGFQTGSLDAPTQTLATWSGAQEALAVAIEGKGEKGDEVWASAVRRTGRGQLMVQTKMIGKKGAAPLEQVVALAIGLLGQPEPAARSAEVLAAEARRRTWGYVSAGAGLVAGGAAVFVGLGAQSKASEARNTPQVDTAAYVNSANAARSAALAADALYLLAGAAVGTGLYLVIANTPPAATEPKLKPQAGIAVFPGGGAVTLGGTF